MTAIDLTAAVVQSHHGDAYRRFLEAKACAATTSGFEIDPAELSPILKPHQAVIARWMIRGGSRACFARFGLGKTLIQLEVMRIILERVGGRGLIGLPLGVRQEFFRDAFEKLRWPIVPTFIRTTEEAKSPGIYLTNYESIREQKLDPAAFSAVDLDEADVLRSFGSKTFSEIVIGPWKDVPYRFLATATPDPNDYIELLGYAQFLNVMDIGQAKTRFFKRDSEHADHLTLHAHKESEFWRWVASWAVIISKPSDLGFSDEGYDLPPMTVHWHEVPSNHAAAGAERSGQGRLFKNAAYSVTEAAKEKRESLGARIAKLQEIRSADPGAHRLIWHTLEAERKAIEEACPGVVSIYGTQDMEERERAVIDFSDGKIQELAAKPSIAGAGCNFQRHCAEAVFLGIDHKFRDLIQAIHRIARYLQPHDVHIHLIHTEAERPIVADVQEKWQKYNRQSEHMSQLIRELGLAEVARAPLVRSLGVERQEVAGRTFRLILNDCVDETRTMPTDRIGLTLTSWPFASQYEYTPSYNDFGHTDSNAHFFAQMDFLTPEIYRTLMPGRCFVLHVKDRVVPGAMTGLGFQVVYPFHAEAILHCQRHGFAFLGMKTIVTDVVRENNQTYRLGWTEQCKDGSRMGAGMPEYLLILRKPPTDNSNGYADVPVVKTKQEYSRARWQTDAHGFTRSNGDRFLSPDEIAGRPWREIYQRFRLESGQTVYDFERHVALGEALERKNQLPPDFMLLPPVSWHPDVWTDVTRMRSLNTNQAAKGRVKHLCPLPFDIVNRVIAQYSMSGDVVFDPFSGLGTVPYCAVKLGRDGWGVELNRQYFADSLGYCRAAETDVEMPTLFSTIADMEEDITELEQEPAA